MRLIDLSGKTFGRLFVLGKGNPRIFKCGQKHLSWVCRCSCGKIVEVTGHALRRGTLSCGCLNNYCNRPDEYSAFRYFIRNAMRYRGNASAASNKPITISVKDLKEQWERQNGICPYTGWKLFIAGHKRNSGERQPDQASLDRIDSSLGYEPGNIQFIALIANYAKNSFDADVMIRFCKAVVLNHPDSMIANKFDMAIIKQRIVELDAIGI